MGREQDSRTGQPASQAAAGGTTGGPADWHWAGVIMTRFRTRAAAVAAAAVIVPAVAAAGVPAVAAAAAGQAGACGTVVTDVRTVAAFDYGTGQQLENITINPDGSKTISMLGSPVGQPPELVLLEPSGRRIVLVTGVAGDTIAGNTRGPDGTIDCVMDSPDAARSGVWKLPPGGTPQRISALPANEFLNGLAIDTAGRTLYATDTLASTIWAIPALGGPARTWLVSPLLAPTQPEPNRYGANGLRFHQGALWVTDTNQGTLLRVPVTASGAPGHVHVITRDAPGIDDIGFLSARSDVVFAALNGPGEVAVIYPDGTTQVVLTAANGLDSPSATAVSGTRLYITNAGVAAPHDPRLQSAEINLAALLACAGS